MGASYRKIMCPHPIEGVTYRLSNAVTGEIRETSDLALLLRVIAEDCEFAAGYGSGSLTLKLEREVTA